MTTTTTRRIEMQCPNCRRKLAAPDHAVGKRGRCPHCSTSILIPPPTPVPVARQFEVVATPAPTRTPSAQPADTPPTFTHAAAAVPAGQQPAPPVSRRNDDGTETSISPFVKALSRGQELAKKARIRERPGPWLIAGAAAIGLVMLIVLAAKLSGEDLELLVMAIGNLFGIILLLVVLLLPWSIPVPLYFTAHHRARRPFDIVFYVVWLGPIIQLEWFFVVQAIFGNVSEAILGAIVCTIIVAIPWFCVAHWPARWLAPLACALVFRRLKCPHCKEKIEAKGAWHCGCGYRDHRRRHIYLFRCPSCRSRCGTLPCPRCEATILL